MEMKWQAAVVFGFLLAGCGPSFKVAALTAPQAAPKAKLTSKQQKILASLEKQIAANLKYDAAYTKNGLPKPGTGVCIDVVIKSAAAIGIDLKREVTKEIAANPRAYKVSKPDPGIDHRRCRTVIYWFKKHTKSLSLGSDFQPGDIVFYSTPGNGKIDHVGVIGGRIGSDGLPTFVHHWPGRPVEEVENPVVFKVVGHFRF